MFYKKGKLEVSMEVTLKVEKLVWLQKAVYGLAGSGTYWARTFKKGLRTIFV